MRIEIDTSRKEIVIIEASTAEVMDLCGQYEGFKIVSKVEFQQPFTPQPFPYEPYNPNPFPNTPWYVGDIGSIDAANTLTKDQLNKEYFG